MAFTSGLTVTVNNFIVKATGVDFGELMAVRGLMQMPVMFTIIALQGKIPGFFGLKGPIIYLTLIFDKFIGNIKKMIPPTLYLKLLTLLVGCFGACIMLSTFACVKFMPVNSFLLFYTVQLWTFQE